MTATRGAPAVIRSSARTRHSHFGDEQLVTAIAQRDPGALGAAYGQYGSRVHEIARRVCGDTRAEELTQEIFLRLWAEPQRFDPHRGSLCTYLLMHAHGRAVDVLRSDNAR